MTTYVVGIDNTVGASADNQTKATVIQILQNAGHTVYDAGRGPNQVQSFGKRSEASGTIAVYLVGGSDIGTYVDFQEGIGHYYKYSECIFAFQSWIGNRWITCEGLSTIPLVRAHDDNFSKQSAIQPYLGQPATYFFEQSPNCSYVCGDSAEELANKILNGDDGGGTSTSGDGQETWGYDKSKPFEAYMYVNYWINDDRENNHKIYIDFSKEAMTTSYKFKDFKTESFSHKLGAWLNDTIKSTSFNLLEMFQIANDDLQGKNTYWLNTIGFETHFPPVDGEFVSKDSDGNETNNNVAYDSSKDHSSYKMDLYSLVFYNGEDLSAIDYDSYAQPVNDTLKKVLGDTSYCIDMLYKPHRNEDVMVFKNQNKKMSSKCTFVEDPYADLKYKADPIKYIPITKISNIQYSPLKNTITNYNVSYNCLNDTL